MSCHSAMRRTIPAPRLATRFGGIDISSLKPSPDVPAADLSFADSLLRKRDADRLAVPVPSSDRRPAFPHRPGESGPINVARLVRQGGAASPVTSLDVGEALRRYRERQASIQDVHASLRRKSAPQTAQTENADKSTVQSHSAADVPQAETVAAAPAGSEEMVQASETAQPVDTQAEPVATDVEAMLKQYKARRQAIDATNESREPSSSSSQGLSLRERLAILREKRRAAPKQSHEDSAVKEPRVVKETAEEEELRIEDPLFPMFRQFLTDDGLRNLCPDETSSEPLAKLLDAPDVLPLHPADTLADFADVNCATKKKPPFEVSPQAGHASAFSSDSHDSQWVSERYDGQYDRHSPRADFVGLEPVSAADRVLASRRDVGINERVSATGIIKKALASRRPHA
ncbi:hypothetical protein FISHEDRAFT_71322 [Fistulina hepatica ATCC 64428]|nr:hypothetical protein FISHEDRAFT_71322 [Fistulina hepatica ATCC 64428]